MSDRLDRLENLVESNAKAILALTNQGIELNTKIDRTSTLILAMDFHLNSILNLSESTVFTCYHQADFICLHLQLNNLGITCPNCQNYTDNLHDTGYNVKLDNYFQYVKLDILANFTFKLH